MRGGPERLVDIPRAHEAPNENVVGTIRMNERRRRARGFLDVEDGLQRSPGDREARQNLERRTWFENDRGHRFSDVARFVDRKDRLVDERWDHSERVAPGNISGGQDADHTRFGRDESVEITE